MINRGYGSLDLLDAFMTLRFDNRLRFRIGRMKTPYLYEYFSIAEGDLISPERSIYAGNMALNRQMGMMFLGNLFDDRLSYATGVFNGPRRSFQDFNSAKDLIGNVTARPWLNSESFPALKYLNLGGSWDVGYEANSPPQPTFFQTANDQTAHRRPFPLTDIPGAQQERHRARRAGAMGRARGLVLQELFLHRGIRRRPSRLRHRQQQVLHAGQL